MDLKDPVEDQLGFVYERAAILDWFTHQPGRGDVPVDAPFAGEARRGPDFSCLQLPLC